MIYRYQARFSSDNIILKSQKVCRRQIRSLCTALLFGKLQVFVIDQIEVTAISFRANRGQNIHTLVIIDYKQVWILV